MQRLDQLIFPGVKVWKEIGSKVSEVVGEFLISLHPQFVVIICSDHYLQIKARLVRVTNVAHAMRILCGHSLLYIRPNSNLGILDQGWVSRYERIKLYYRPLVCF